MAVPAPSVFDACHVKMWKPLKSHMKPAKEPHEAPEPRVGHPCVRVMGLIELRLGLGVSFVNKVRC